MAEGEINAGADVTNHGLTLTDTEKQRIALEEGYRRSLQESGDAARKEAPQRHGLLSLAEGSIGRFLLASIVLPMCVAGYTYFKAASSEQQVATARALENKNTIERLDLEISFRYSKTISRLKALSRQTTPHTAAQLQSAIAPLTSSADITSNPPLYLEFNALSGYALMAELRRKLPEWQFLGKPLPGTVGFALAELSALEGTLEAGSVPGETLAQRLADIMTRPVDGDRRRWAKGFSGTDCASTKPFC